METEPEAGIRLQREYVESLPMRDGNAARIRKGTFEPSVESLPMRDGNHDREERRDEVEAVESLPMRDGNRLRGDSLQCGRELRAYL